MSQLLVPHFNPSTQSASVSQSPSLSPHLLFSVQHESSPKHLVEPKLSIIMVTFWNRRDFVLLSRYELYAIKRHLFVYLSIYNRIPQVGIGHRAKTLSSFDPVFHRCPSKRAHYRVHLSTHNILLLHSLLKTHILCLQQLVPTSSQHQGMHSSCIRDILNRIKIWTLAE